MSQPIQCPRCKADLETPTAAPAGATMLCPICGERFTDPVTAITETAPANAPAVQTAYAADDGTARDLADAALPRVEDETQAPDVMLKPRTSLAVLVTEFGVGVLVVFCCFLPVVGAAVRIIFAFLGH